MSKLSNIFSSGKNPKWLYFAKCYLRKLIPNAFFRHRLERKLKNAEKRSDYGYIKERVDYYCQLACNTPLPADTPTLHSATKMGHKAYRFDTEEFTR